MFEPRSGNTGSSRADTAAHKAFAMQVSCQSTCACVGVRLHMRHMLHIVRSADDRPHRLLLLICPTAPQPKLALDFWRWGLSQLTRSGGRGSDTATVVGEREGGVIEGGTVGLRVLTPMGTERLMSGDHDHAGFAAPTFAYGTAARLALFVCGSQRMTVDWPGSGKDSTCAGTVCDELFLLRHEVEEAFAAVPQRWTRLSTNRVQLPKDTSSGCTMFQLATSHANHIVKAGNASR